MEKERKNDFTKGSIIKRIMELAIPMTFAQLINVLYSVIDRVYIGHIPQEAALSLTGLGLTFPIITIVIAFANLFGMGGAPLCSIARGKNRNDEAEQIMGNSFALLLMSGLLLTVIGLLFKTPLLYLFGASEATLPYADSYITIYLCGSIFVITGLGMNSFINSQGFGKMGMAAVLIGAVINLVLDPIFIFLLHMGVQGAAFATVIAQAVSAVWVLRFLFSDKAIIRLRFQRMRLKAGTVKEIVMLGMSGFIMAATNSAVQIACNATLQKYGGDLYVGVMTVINSIREVLTMPVNGITNGAQPVLGYNYGAGAYQRVKKAVIFISAACIVYTTAAWGILVLFPETFLRIFNRDPLLIEAGVPAMKLYFFGFFMMSLQFSGQSTFLALGKSKQAICFSLLRKAVIVVPLTLFLPQCFHLSTNGVFLAEPISNFIGGTACYLTMLYTLRRMLCKTSYTC